MAPDAAEEPAARLAARLRAIVGEYDDKWCALDIAGVAELWERDTPQPVYIADEYAMPLIGTAEIDRHWARIAGRLKRASVSSQLRFCDVFTDGVTRAILLSRWSFTGRESDVAHTGASWISWLLVTRGQEHRIFHHMESPAYLDDDPDTRLQDQRA